MKKIILILIVLLILLNSCVSTGNSNDTESLDEAYAELVFDNETPFDKMEISNVTEFDKKLCILWQRYSYSMVPNYEEFKDDFEHLYIRQNKNNVYVVARMNYEGTQYYLISYLVPAKYPKLTLLRGQDGALIYNKLPDVSVFDEVKSGVTTFEDIKKIDKSVAIYGGSYASNHRLRDGRILVIWYKNTGTEVVDKDYVVRDIYFEEDRHNFLDKLLPIDREAIT